MAKNLVRQEVKEPTENSSVINEKKNKYIIKN